MNGKKILTYFVLILFLALALLELVYIPFFGVKPGNEAIPFWQHPPKVIILHAAYLISPVLVKPVDLLLFWAVGFGVWLGFRQVSSKNVLVHPERNRIHAFIRDHPGIHFRELERQTGINRGTLTYHLDMLGQTNKILAIPGSGYTRYFENGGKFSDREQQILSSYSNDRQRAILLLLLESPRTPTELKENLHVSGPSVSWHMKRLCHDQMVTVRQEGRNARYVLDPEVRTFLQDRGAL
ncbi:winged helix-turn-helix transcriptional regulator [Methanoregula sp.]|jgi:predicted transcriptional regulator|uniref:winged helix-turn-helix transcriptional regulator n=1 Tax=Methanoregula sp. TaxID=2052170 RepID=UPI00356AFBBE